MKKIYEQINVTESAFYRTINAMRDLQKKIDYGSDVDIVNSQFTRVQWERKLLLSQLESLYNTIYHNVLLHNHNYDV